MAKVRRMTVVSTLVKPAARTERTTAGPVGSRVDVAGGAEGADGTAAVSGAAGSAAAVLSAPNVCARWAPAGAATTRAHAAIAATRVATRAVGTGERASDIVRHQEANVSSSTLRETTTSLPSLS